MKKYIRPENWDKITKRIYGIKAKSSPGFIKQLREIGRVVISNKERGSFIFFLRVDGQKLMWSGLVYSRRGHVFIRESYCGPDPYTRGTK